MDLTGTIISRSCSLRFNMTSTAVRIDWEAATGAAVTYSVWQTLSCLAQIVLLLRQLHHTQTQTQSGAARVSVMTVGTQAIIGEEEGGRTSFLTAISSKRLH